MKALALALAATLLGIAFWIAVAFGGEQVTMALAGSDWADRLGGLDTIALLILLAGVPVHAAGLRVWFAHIGRPRVPLPWAPALLVTVASLAWWFLSLMLLYGLFGGDPGPGRTPPPAGQVYRLELLVVLAPVALHALVLWQLRRRLGRYSD